MEKKLYVLTRHDGLTVAFDTDDEAIEEFRSNLNRYKNHGPRDPESGVREMSELEYDLTQS